MKKLVLIAAFALGAYGQAQAQTPFMVVKSSTVEIWNDTLMSDHFKKNPSDTLRFEGCVEFEQDTTVCGHPVKVGDVVFLKLSCYLIGPLEVHRQEDFIQKVFISHSNRASLAAQIDTVTTRTRFVGGLNMDPKLRYDVIYAESDLYDKTDGKPLLRYGRKDGLNLLIGAGYQFGKVPGLDVHAGFAYVTKIRLKFEVTGGINRLEMVTGSDRAGESYMAYNTQATVGFQPFKLNRYDQWRVWVEGGMRLCFYNTGWQGNVQSAGSSIAPVFGITAAHRFFATRHMVALNLSTYMLPQVYTNNTQHRDWGVTLTARWYLNLEKGFWHAR